MCLLTEDVYAYLDVQYYLREIRIMCTEGILLQHAITKVLNSVWHDQRQDFYKEHELFWSQVESQLNVSDQLYIHKKYRG